MSRAPSIIQAAVSSLFFTATALLAQHSTLHAAPQNPQFEKPTILSASKLLPPSLLEGPYHRVSERVTSDGYFNNYRIESKFGVMTVEGRQLLETRVGEMNALAELDKLSSSSVFADAAYKAGKGIITAPVRIVEKTAKTLSDPEKLGDTLAAVPEGAERLFSWAYRKGKGAVQAIGDAVSSDSDNKKPAKSATPSESSSISTSEAIDQGTKFGLKYIGYTKREREWFRKLHVNPYTSNELLRSEIIRVAGIETAVGTAFRFVPGLGLLGELSTFNTWYERAEKLALYEDPDAIGKKNQQELRALGVPEEIAKQFLSNPAYTPWSRRFISNSLTTIGPKVTGHAEFIKAACAATNEPSTLYFVSVAESLEKLHAVSPIKRIIASLYLPAAVTTSNQLYIPLPVDYLFWTEEVAEIFKDFKKRIKKEARITSAQMNIAGRASPLARHKLLEMGISVTESAPSITPGTLAPER
jgi:hypothetical protein